VPLVQVRLALEEEEEEPPLVRAPPSQKDLARSSLQLRPDRTIYIAMAHLQQHLGQSFLPIRAVN
jgi:hypothetical protein